MSRAALFVRWMLGISAAAFFVLGILCYVSPAMVISAMDIKADPGKAMADIRAVYGGLDVAVGILLGICFFRKEWANGLAISALVLACAFVGRLIEILIEPLARDLLTYGLSAVEIVGAVLSAVGWFLARRETTHDTPVAAPETPGVTQT